MVTDGLAEKLVSDPTGFLKNEGIEAPAEHDVGKKILSFCNGTIKCGERRRKACDDPRCADGRTCMDHLNYLKARPDFVQTMCATKQFEEAASEMDLERIYAMVVGRYRDGRPIVAPEAGRDANDFDFAGDPDGLSCPFHAHARRMNTRGQQVRAPSEYDETAAGEEAGADGWEHVIARRGMPYQHEYADESARCGLYFVSFQSGLTQFEALLAHADDDRYVQTGYNEDKWAAPPVGIDPIFGDNPAPADQTWPRLDGSEPPTSVTRFKLTHYATLRGGGYFFAPSIQYIENIEEISDLV